MGREGKSELKEGEKEKKETAPTTCWNLGVSAEANQGGRKYMEDVTAVHFERANGVEFASFAIFDGHGGREASHFAKDNLMSYIKKEKGFFSTQCNVVKKSHSRGFPGLSPSNASKTTRMAKNANGTPVHGRDYSGSRHHPRK